MELEQYIIPLNKTDLKIKIIENPVPNWTFDVVTNNVDSEVIIEFPRLFYLGYTLKDEDGHRYELYENENEFLTSKITKKGTYNLIYTGTRLYKLSLCLQMLAVIGFLIFVLRKKLKYSSNLGK